MGKKIKTTEAGFTLIETFVAITVLVFAIIGPLQLFSQSIVDSNYAKNQITGFYLAAEGLDLVINKKENNMMARVSNPSISWLRDLGTLSSGVNDINPINLSVVSDSALCSAVGCALYIDPNTGIYQPKAPNQDIRPSIFRRQIKVTEIVGTDQAKVVSSVRWIDRGKSQGVDLVTYISNE